MVEESRRFSRIDFWGVGELTVANRMYRIEHIDDLSVGGCSFVLGAEVVLKATGTIKMILAEGQLIIHAECEIARVDGKKIGLSFTGITPEDLTHLKNLILYNTSDLNQVEKEMEERSGIK
ncbi:MAG: PilZ domain-containing protein [Desulfotalea sp.]